MFSIRRFGQAILAAVAAFAIFRIVTPHEPVFGFVAVLLGVIFYALDPFGPERGGFGTHGDDDFGLGG